MMKKNLKEGLKELIETLDNCIEAIEAIDDLKNEVDYEMLRECTRELDRNFKEALPMYGNLVEPVNEYVRNKRLILYSKHLEETTGLCLDELLSKEKKKCKSWDI